MPTVCGRVGSAQRVAKEINEDVGDGEWFHAACFGEITDILHRTFAAMGHCLFPLYITPVIATEWFPSWKVINEQRMGRNKWTFMGTDEESSPLPPSVALFRAIVKRNQD